MPTHSKQEANDKQKCRSHQSLGEFKKFSVITYRNMDKGLFYKHIRAMIPRHLYNQSPPQHGGQLTKTGNLEFTAQPAGSLIG